MKSLLTQRVEKECKLLFTLQWRPDYKCMAAGCLMYLVIWHPAHSMVRHSWQSSLKASPSNVKTLFQPRSPPSVWPNFDDSGYISRSYVLATSPPPPQIYVSVWVGGWVAQKNTFCFVTSTLHLCRQNIESQLRSISAWAVVTPAGKIKSQTSRLDSCSSRVGRSLR